jgi:hypothetical protein
MNFKQQSLDFVRRNNCAMHVPAHLIEKAMKEGAAEGIKLAISQIVEARIEMNKKRLRNNRG